MSVHSFVGAARRVASQSGAATLMPVNVDARAANAQSDRAKKLAKRASRRKSRDSELLQVSDHVRLDWDVNSGWILHAAWPV
jgi:hypothetical protein